MAIYVEMLTEAIIKEKIKDAHRIAIIGCPRCMNTCLAANSATGVIQELDESLKEFRPRALLDKISELRDIFIHEGKNVVSHVAYVCGLDRNALKYLTADEAVQTSDVILSLSCPSALVGLRILFPGHRIVSATKSPILGTFFIEQETLDNGRVKKIIPGTARIFRQYG
jgi:hypothetical protein